MKRRLTKTLIGIFLLSSLFTFSTLIQNVEAQSYTEVQIYENEELGLSVSHPLSFIKVDENPEPGALVLYTDSDKEIVSNILFEYPLVIGSMEEFLQPTIDQLRLEFNNFQLVESEVISVADQPAMKLLYTTTDLGFNAEVMQIIITKNEVDYIFTFVTPFERFDENLPVIQEIINSIKINDVKIPIILYENPTYGFKIKHPANWVEIEEIGDAYRVSFISNFKSMEDLIAEETNIVITENTKDQSLEEGMDEVEVVYPQIFRNFKMIESQSTTVSGNPAHKIVYTGKIVNPYIDSSSFPIFFDNPVIRMMNLALSEEIDAKILQIFYLKDDLIYVLTYRASPDDYDSSLSIAQEIINSFQFDDTSSSITTIPDWIRNNAEWWAQGAIGDNDFVSGIQYLIKEGIMHIPETVSAGDGDSQEIPAWIKNNADWWAQGLISDDDFVKGIQYLVEQGIIKV